MCGRKPKAGAWPRFPLKSAWRRLKRGPTGARLAHGSPGADLPVSDARSDSSRRHHSPKARLRPWAAACPPRGPRAAYLSPRRREGETRRDDACVTARTSSRRGRSFESRRAPASEAAGRRLLSCGRRITGDGTFVEPLQTEAHSARRQFQAHRASALAPDRESRHRAAAPPRNLPQKTSVTRPPIPHSPEARPLICWAGGRRGRPARRSRRPKQRPSRLRASRRQPTRQAGLAQPLAHTLRTDAATPRFQGLCGSGAPLPKPRAQVRFLPGALACLSHNGGPSGRGRSAIAASTSWPPITARCAAPLWGPRA